MSEPKSDSIIDLGLLQRIGVEDVDASCPGSFDLELLEEHQVIISDGDVVLQQLYKDMVSGLAV